MISKKRNLSAILAIVAGILIIAWPAIVAIALGIYLIILGVLDLLGK